MNNEPITSIQALTFDVIIDALRKIIVVCTPFLYNIEEEVFIKVGDLVKCHYKLDDTQGYEVGIVDFKNGCFVIVIEGSEEDSLLLSEYVNDLELLDNPNDSEQEFLNNYIQERLFS